MTKIVENKKEFDEIRMEFQLPNDPESDDIEYWKGRSQQFYKQYIEEQLLRFGGTHCLLCDALKQHEFILRVITDPSCVGPEFETLRPEFNRLIKHEKELIQIYQEWKDSIEKQAIRYEKFPWEEVGLAPSVFPEVKTRNRT
jgi:hypothetical protein